MEAIFLFSFVIRSLRTISRKHKDKNKNKKKLRKHHSAKLKGEDSPGKNKSNRPFNIVVGTFSFP